MGDLPGEEIQTVFASGLAENLWIGRRGSARSSLHVGIACIVVAR